MKRNLHKLFSRSLMIGGAALLLTGCNKDRLTAVPITPAEPTGSTAAATVTADASLSILNAAITRAGTGIQALLADRSAVYTIFAPTDAAFQASGIPSAAALAAFRPGQLDTILRYHIVGGVVITSAQIPTTFPNLQLPSQLVLQAPSAMLPPGLRMPLFASRRTLSYVNNIPIVAPDAVVANGVVHRIGAVLQPPTTVLWTRINTDANLTYLRAAIVRADSGSGALQAALQNPGANLTVFAPNNTAVQTILTGLITQALVAQGVPPATAAAQATALASSPTVFSNPVLYSALSATTVRGLVVYHILGSRAFSVNLPTTATSVSTLLNGGIPTHPGVSITATFNATATGVTAATVRGIANPSASNILINPTPGTGTSDQHYVNGVLHVIDQLLRPQ